MVRYTHHEQWLSEKPAEKLISTSCAYPELVEGWFEKGFDCAQPNVLTTSSAITCTYVEDIYLN